jgi:integrase
LRREWVNADRIDFPAETMKTKKAHTIPLSPLAAALLTRIPIEEGFLFPARRRGEHEKGERSFNGWSKDEMILDRRIVPALSPRVLQDLRRTATTRWAELAVPPHINDMLLAHAMRGVSAMHRIYNLANYLEPMRDALRLWEARLQTLLSNTEGTNGPEFPGLHYEGARATE